MTEEEPLADVMMITTAGGDHLREEVVIMTMMIMIMRKEDLLEIRGLQNIEVPEETVLQVQEEMTGMIIQEADPEADLQAEQKVVPGKNPRKRKAA